MGCSRAGTDWGLGLRVVLAAGLVLAAGSCVFSSCSTAASDCVDSIMNSVTLERTAGAPGWL